MNFGFYERYCSFGERMCQEETEGLNQGQSVLAKMRMVFLTIRDAAYPEVETDGLNDLPGKRKASAKHKTR
jgi:hypothetical protein